MSNTTNYTSKRQDYINWDQYFMGIAQLSKERSKDPSTQVGACVVSEDNKIISIGYNGFPNGINDDDLPWGREGNFLDKKYAYVCHAELNTIMNCNLPNLLRGSTIYVTMFPCNECSKIIIQAGIKRVVYWENKYEGQDFMIASKKLLNLAGIKFEQYNRTGREMTLHL